MCFEICETVTPLCEITHFDQGSKLDSTLRDRHVNRTCLTQAVCTVHTNTAILSVLLKLPDQGLTNEFMPKAAHWHNIFILCHGGCVITRGNNDSASKV